MSKLTTADIQEIMSLINSSNFDTLKIEMDDFKLTLHRTPPPSTMVEAPTVVQKFATVPIAAPAAPVTMPQSGLIDVKAPILGLFFRAPKPGADPFVKPGSRVTPDTPIGIIEVMKLMNPVVAGVSGEVVEIVAPDGELIEFDVTILRVRPD